MREHYFLVLQWQGWMWLVALVVILGVYVAKLHLASVVQKLDSAIHWINHYPVDKC